MLTSDLLRAQPRVRHAFFDRRGGVSEGIYDSLNCGFGSDDVQERVAENRRRAMARLERDTRQLVTAYQVHSPDVAVVEDPWAAGQAPRVDAMVTTRPGVTLGILTADCAPVLLADGTAGVIGAAHAGWKGALGGVLEAVVDSMIAQGAARERIGATIGPSIAQESYEVGADFPDPFLARHPDDARFFSPGAREGRWQFSLTGYVMARLDRAGITSVDCLTQDTYAEPARFFSYRRTCHRGETDYGRNLSAITLDP